MTEEIAREGDVKNFTKTQLKPLEGPSKNNFKHLSYFKTYNANNYALL